MTRQLPPPSFRVWTRCWFRCRHTTSGELLLPLASTPCPNTPTRVAVWCRALDPRWLTSRLKRLKSDLCVLGVKRNTRLSKATLLAGNPFPTFSRLVRTKCDWGYAPSITIPLRATAEHTSGGKVVTPERKNIRFHQARKEARDEIGGTI